MDNNDILRRMRFIFDFSDSRIIEIFGLGNLQVTRAQISDWLKKEDDLAFQAINDQQMAIFLNGFICLKRGKKEGMQPKPEKRLNNNIILRKLKIGLNLRDEDVLAILKLVGKDISKHELSAFFRNPEHEKYRSCKDQILRNFLQGIKIKYHSDKK